VAGFGSWGSLGGGFSSSYIEWVLDDAAEAMADEEEVWILHVAGGHPL
jgi:hypothetical protein